MSVFNYLYEWAEENGNWAKLLVKLIIENGSLNDTCRKLVYQQFLIDISLYKEKFKKVDLSQLIRKKSNFSDLKLISIENITGVNKLAPEQKLKFSPNLTIIYGMNASGKTGYSRILQSVGFCQSDKPPIIQNIFKKAPQKISAKIKYKTDNNEIEYPWDGQNNNDLKYVGIFTNDCVKISLNEKRNPIVKPYGFFLFDRIKEELNLILTILEEDTEAKLKKPSWINDNLNQNTNIYKLLHQELSQINPKKLIDSINSLSFGKNEKDSLKKLNSQLNNLNTTLISKKINEYTNQIQELENFVAQIKTIKETLTYEEYTNLKTLHGNILNLKKTKQKSISEIALERGIKLYDSNEFAEFIKKAENYIKLIETSNSSEYPNDNDKCIYCQQTLSLNSKNLITSYRKLLKDQTESELKNTEQQYALLIKKISGLNIELKFHHSPYGNNPNTIEDIITPIYPVFLSSLFTKIKKTKEKILEEKFNNCSEEDFNILFGDTIKQISTKIKKLSDLKKQEQENIKKFETKKKIIIDQIHQIEDIKILTDNKSSALEFANNLVYINILQKKKNKLYSKTLSLKSSKARKKLIDEKYIASFKEERKKLRCPRHIILELGTSKAQPVIKQQLLNKYSIKNILSEGEQKSLALAEFLTELKLCEVNGPVVFDDPVCSLDIERREMVAGRLVELSLDKQVIIFTHDMFFIYEIEQILENLKYQNKSVKHKYFIIEQDTDWVGFLTENIPHRKETFNEYKKSIQAIITTPKKDRHKTNHEMAMDGYLILRKAIEILIVNNLFKKTTTPYRRMISVKQFAAIKFTELDNAKSKIYEIYNRCSEYGGIHTNPPGSKNITANLKQLEEDLNAVCDIKAKCK